MPLLSYVLDETKFQSPKRIFVYRKNVPLTCMASVIALKRIKYTHVQNRYKAGRFVLVVGDDEDASLLGSYILWTVT